MLNTCNLGETSYFIWSEGHTPLNVCGSFPKQPVVAFNDGGLGFYPTRVNRSPNCTYLLVEGNSYIQDVDGNIVLVDDPDPPQEWVVTSQGGDKYTVVKKGTTLAWTDPGGQPGCERQLHLTELYPIRPEVLFEIRPAYD